jgi:hypothetical protein
MGLLVYNHHLNPTNGHAGVLYWFLFYYILTQFCFMFSFLTESVKFLIGTGSNFAYVAIFTFF